MTSFSEPWNWWTVAQEIGFNSGFTSAISRAIVWRRRDCAWYGVIIPTSWVLAASKAREKDIKALSTFTRELSPVLVQTDIMPDKSAKAIAYPAAGFWAATFWRFFSISSAERSNPPYIVWLAKSEMRGCIRYWVSNIHSHLWFLPLSTADVIPQYWKISAFNGEVPLLCTIGGSWRKSPMQIKCFFARLAEKTICGIYAILASSKITTSNRLSRTALSTTALETVVATNFAFLTVSFSSNDNSFFICVSLRPISTYLCEVLDNLLRSAIRSRRSQRSSGWLWIAKL